MVLEMELESELEHFAPFCDADSLLLSLLPSYQEHP